MTGGHTVAQKKASPLAGNDGLKLEEVYRRVIEI
jgi:hypothetical protein